MSTITSKCSKLLTVIPRDVLKIVGNYARPWYGDTAFRFGGMHRMHQMHQSIERDFDNLKFEKKENRWVKLASVPFVCANGKAILHADTSQIFICGGGELFDFASSIIQYSIVEDIWNSMKLPSMHFARCNHTAVEHNSIIYVIGGENRYIIRKSCEAFNIVNNEWNDLPDLLNYHSRHSSVIHTTEGVTYVYAIGGSRSKSAERYNIVLRKWSQIADMLEERRNHCNVVLQNIGNDSILAIGGHDDEYLDSHDNQHWSSVEQWCVNENKWSIAKWTLPEPRAQFSLHKIENASLLICGGFNGKEPLSSCLQINFTESGEFIKIEKVANLPEECFSASAC